MIIDTFVQELTFLMTFVQNTSLNYFLKSINNPKFYWLLRSIFGGGFILTLTVFLAYRGKSGTDD